MSVYLAQRLVQERIADLLRQADGSRRLRDRSMPARPGEVRRAPGARLILLGKRLLGVDEEVASSGPTRPQTVALSVASAVK
jgi:hypothetical protein